MKFSKFSYTTASGIVVHRTASKLPYRRGLRHLLRDLDRHRGIYLSSGYEYPERYSRWDIAALCPPVEILGTGRLLKFQALNDRGVILNQILEPLLAKHPHWDDFRSDDCALLGRLKPLPKLFPEEERSKQPSAFSILRTLIDDFRVGGDPRLA